MKSPLHLSMCIILSFLLFLPIFLPNVSVASAASFLSHPFCQGHDRLALLQFKQSFVISGSASRSPSAYPKIESWNLQGGYGDCCTWDGVECDNSTGHVIGLDLSSSHLHGSINSNSSLFRLVHLRRLNLADNDFNQSGIPSSLGLLSKLINLNLSSSSFSGPIPSDISKLSKLVSLDLHLDFSSAGQLVLKMPDFRMLLQNLTSLEVLHLDGIYIPATVPVSLANLSSLTSLRLQACQLYGEFPPAVLQLANLQYFYVTWNRDLSGYLPEFNSTSPLLELALGETSFKGELPASFGNLRYLQYFDTLNSNFSGKIPASFGNLTELVHLALQGNPFELPNVASLSWLGRQSKLTLLGLENVILNSEFPPYIANLTQLQELYLLDGEISGQIPVNVSQLSRLTTLSLSRNMLQGPIPYSIFQLGSLQRLDLSGNNLSGIMDFDAFLELQNMTSLYLSDNMLSFHAKSIPNTTRQKFAALALGSCNLGRFPSFLRDQDRLEWLDLNDNHIHGMIPSWVWNIGRGTLKLLDLSRNFLTGFEQRPAVLRWVQLHGLDLSSNMLQGSLPIPPQTIGRYFASGNNFTGEVSSAFCNLTNLRSLDLSNNSLGGVLPQCVESLSASLRLLVLGGNNFHGKIPPARPNACNLKVLMLGGNQLEGQVPRSLAYCTKLEILDLGNNQINDAFPSWLTSLQQLKILILRSNRFNGMLGDTEPGSSFPMLRVIDLSQNNFSGQLPSQLFLNWNAMKMTNASRLAYMHTVIRLPLESSFEFRQNFSYQVSLNNKGKIQQYPKMLEFFVAMDLSGNGFTGEIPTSIGNLYGLLLLNLSNNALSGSIPTFFTQLESLDLSRNRFTGEIPRQLTQLNFLEVFDVSENNLTGPIPGGEQFDTFQNSSYEGNSGLCGNPLSRKCGNSEALPPSTSGLEENDERRSSFEFGWRPVVIGYASGLLVGLMIGHVVFTRRYEWFVKTFRVNPQRTTRNRKRRHRD